MVDRLTAAVLPDSALGSMNREVFHADTGAPDAIVSAGWALPLFGGGRLVLVRGLGDAPAKVVDRLKGAVERARGTPQGWPVEGTTVLFVAADADRRSPALRRLLPEADQLEVRAPGGRTLPGWLRERARTAGLDLAPEAAEVLIELTGENLGRLVTELEKAAVYSGDERRVSVDVVRALAGETRVRQLWELTQALEQGERAEALTVLERLLGTGEEPVVVLAWLTGYVRNAWRALGAMAEGDDARRVSQLLRPKRPEWVAERIMARATRMGSSGVAAAIRRCYEVERRLKASGGSPRSLLTVLVSEISG